MLEHTLMRRRERGRRQVEGAGKTRVQTHAPFAVNQLESRQKWSNQSRAHSRAAERRRESAAIPMPPGTPLPGGETAYRRTGIVVRDGETCDLRELPQRIRLPLSAADMGADER